MSAVTKWEHNLCKNRAKFLTTNFATQGKTIFIRVTSCAACVFLNNNFKWTTHTAKTKQHNLPLDSLLILYSCCIFRIKGEVVEGLKNLSSTTNFPFGPPSLNPILGGENHWATYVTTHCCEIHTTKRHNRSDKLSYALLGDRTETANSPDQNRACWEE